MSTIIDSYAGKTVLAIGAHPDDVEISAGGTIARMSRAGVRVVMAAVAIPADLEGRVAEARAAAEILGAELEILEPERCRRVEDFRSYELVARIDKLIKKYEPAAILTHSDEETHHDHVLVHRAVLPSLRLRPMDVYFFAPSTCKPTVRSWQPRIWVDVSETIDDKIRAIAAHRSQFGGRGICIDTFRDQARTRGLPLGFGYAEGLDVLCMQG